MLLMCVSLKTNSQSSRCCQVKLWKCIFIELEEIGLRLDDNKRSPLPDVFVDRIIDGLPSAFDDSKSALKVVTVGKKMDEIQQIIAKTAINVGWQPSKSGDKKEEKAPAATECGEANSRWWERKSRKG